MQLRHSIIIPTSGRSYCVHSAVRSLLREIGDRRDTQVIVVQSSAVEDARISGFCSAHAGVRYLLEPRPGASAARHAGVGVAESDLLSFIDDDVEVAPGWLDAVQTAFADPELALLGGPSIPRFTSSVPAWFWDFMSPAADGGWMCHWLSLLDLQEDVRDVDPEFIWSLNFSIRRNALESCGGFHPDLVPAPYQRWQGDGETGLARKLAAAGRRADYAQRALVFHACTADRMDAGYFCHRAFFQGVCDSFTSIRAGNAAQPDSRPDAAWPVVARFKGAVRRLRALQPDTSPASREARRVRELAAASYVQGWQFHQREVAGDAHLLAWVRRPDFIDTDLRVEAAGRSAYDASMKELHG
ncbi:MAG: glycosyltransferase family 2 protein [Pseudomonadota bacterium]